MSRYDITRGSDLALLAVVRALLGNGRLPLDTTTRRCLEAIASVLLDEASEDFQELAALRTECRLRTQAEHDQLLGGWLRASLSSEPPERIKYPSPEWSDEVWAELRALVHASRSAPEGEP